MYHTRIFSIILFVILQYFIVVNNQCPPSSLIEPCFCIEKDISNLCTLSYPIRAKPTDSSSSILSESPAICENSIVYENIQNSSFDLRSIFIKLNNELAANNHPSSDNFTHFNDFVLNNTQINHLPKNLFGNITFLNIILYNNPLLNSIDIDAFDNTRNYVEQFRTMNTSLSDSDALFIMLKQFKNLKVLSMNNDKLQSIPDYAFNHTKLEYIWLGIPDSWETMIQPLVHIGKYPFYNVPNLHTIHLFHLFSQKLVNIHLV